MEREAREVQGEASATAKELVTQICTAMATLTSE
jgi:hypothetical protein